MVEFYRNSAEANNISHFKWCSFTAEANNISHFKWCSFTAEANNIIHFKCLFQAMLNYTLNHPFLYYDTSNLGRSKDEKPTSMLSFGIPVLVSTNLVIPVLVGTNLVIPIHEQ